MQTEKPAKRYEILRLEDIAPRACPCGSTRRAFQEETAGAMSLHLVEIKEDAATHYHRRLTEVYYVLEGSGSMELDGESLPVGPGCAILIRPGCRHRAVGKLRVLNVVVPAFDPEDEWFD